MIVVMGPGKLAQREGADAALLSSVVMRIRLSDSRSRAAGARRDRVSARGARSVGRALPPPCARGLRAAAKAAGFRGKDREIAAEGGWVLCGLGTGAGPAGAAAGGAAPGGYEDAAEGARGRRSRSVSTRRFPRRPSAPSCSTSRSPTTRSTATSRRPRRRPGPDAAADARSAAGTRARRLFAARRGTREAVADGRRLGPRRRQHAGQRPRPERPRARGEGAWRRAGRLPAARPRQARDREGEDGRSARRQRRERPAAGVPRRRVRAAKAARHRRPRRQGHHLRFGRHLAQAGAVDGRDEVRHDGRGDRVRLPRGGEVPRASGPRRRARSGDREHAGRHRRRGPATSSA